MEELVIGETYHNHKDNKKFRKILNIYEELPYPGGLTKQYTTTVEYVNEKGKQGKCSNKTFAIWIGWA